MSEAPKKIWVTSNNLIFGFEAKACTPYIRADVVKELAEAMYKLLDSQSRSDMGFPHHPELRTAIKEAAANALMDWEEIDART